VCELQLVKKASLTVLVSTGLLVAGVALAAQGGQKPGTAGKGGKMPFTLKSAAFSEGANIPSRHTCDGLNLSPPLNWSGQPAGTKSLVLKVDDPDAPGGTFLHWIFFDIAGATGALPEGQPATKLGQSGINDFGKIAYGGPCPPPGRGSHRYFFKLSALDIPSLGLNPGATLIQIEQRLKGHVLGTCELMARYERKR
jgi:Raf kinase inhibitor-like YbhB/YbcL family protein